MKKSYGVNELRRMYLEFFESKGHLAMKSFHWCLTMTTVCFLSMQVWHHLNHISQDRRFHRDVV